MGIKFLKLAFFASTTVITFAAGVGVGTILTAWDKGTQQDWTKMKDDADKKENEEV